MFVCVALLGIVVSGHGYGEIELVRDQWGVPNVFAATDEGAMYGLGYACAEDRGVQMHLKLRIMQGRLAETVGDLPGTRQPHEGPIWSDKKNRTLGWVRAAKDVVERLDPTTQRLLQAYSDGVNAFYRENGDSLHEFYERIGIAPEEWKPEHCVLAWWHLGQFFAGDGTRKLIQYRGDRTMTDEARSMMPRMVVDDGAAVVQRSDVSDDWVARVDEFLRKHGLDSGASGLLGGEVAPKFSHAWVVGNPRSTDGSATLVSDPQTPVTYPSLLYEFYAKGKTIHGRGVGVPGCPSLLIGFTPHVAWGLTALGADQTELFLLRTRGNEYELDGEWRQMEVSRETIQVKGGRSIEYVVRRTSFGPVFTEFCFAAPGDPEVALKRVPLVWSGGEAVQASLEMMTATTRSEFLSSIGKWNFPSANIVFGFKNGDIGYWTVFANPVRSAKAKGAAAVPGHRSEYDWQGFVPFDLLPHVLNPRGGTLYSGNHRPIASFYKIPIGNSTGAPGHSARSWRLSELLDGEGMLSPDAVLQIHYDAVNPARREIARIGLLIRERMPSALSPASLRLLAELEVWLKDGASMDLRKPGAQAAMRINTQFRPMGTSLAAEYGGGESGLSLFLRTALRRLERDPESLLKQDELRVIDLALAGGGGREAPPQSQRDAYQLFETTFAFGTSAQNQRQAPPPQRGQAAEREFMGAFQGLDGLPSLDVRLNVPVPPLYVTDGATIHSQRQQSYTQWVPLADPDRALALLPPGNVESPRSAYRTSALDDWAAGRLRPAPLSKSAVEKYAVSRRKL